ncbi:MAG TPA: DEAD/DEAH box helicase [Drouetiella sp.]
MKTAKVAAGALDWAHPLVRDWFLAKFGSATEPQEQGWPHILAGRTTLISAPTGSGKTLAAFLACIDRLVRLAVANELGDKTSVVYISPLKALSNDIQKNLDTPLAEIRELAESRGIEMAEIRTAVRTGDTLMKERQAMLRKHPHILVTTPESLYILLTAGKSRELLANVETVIVDEIHAVADDKRGSHLSISLERLDKVTYKKPNRVGLSATQNPIELVAHFLTGAQGVDPIVVNVGHRRTMDLAIELPTQPIQPIASQEFSAETFDRLAELVNQHRSTIVFVNTRKQAERIAMHLASRIGEEEVACHHGSLSRQIRLAAETRLKNGEIKVLVATASLELGIDVGFVDLVCQINGTKAIATALQRVGRAGHWRGAIPKGRFFPYTRDELIETAALIRAIKHNDLDKLEIPENCLDILAQQIVAMAAVEELNEEQLFQDIRKAYPYRNLPREKFDEVIQMLSDGISARRGRYGAYLMRDQVNDKLSARRGARLAAITSGGAIPESALYGVVAEPDGVNVGTLDEHFAIDSHRGDVFMLGTTSWRIRRIDNVAGKVYVEDAHGASPSVPFWFGEAPARTSELSYHVSELRRHIDELTKTVPVEYGAHSKRTEEIQKAIDWITEECGLPESGAEQLIEYIVQGRAILGAVPTIKQVVAERFFDEGGGMQLILHTPFGGRINRAWGLALRKKFCRNFNLELQAAATEDGISIALAEQHSFPLGDVFYYLSPDNIQHTLEQAALQGPIFQTRWRWDAMRSLALLRFMGGKKVPPYLQRLKSDDLLSAVFPGAAACQDNTPGDVEIPNHPLIEEVMKDVLYEAMDLDGLKKIINDIRSGEITCLAIDTPTPSQFAAEIINANVYAFLDDAGIEERRTRAVEMRRVLPNAAGELGKLEPAAIEKTIEQAWPDIRNADELHDLLKSVIAIPEQSPSLHMQPAQTWGEFFEGLQTTRRATRLTVNDAKFWVCTERLESAKLIWPDAKIENAVPEFGTAPPDRQIAISNTVRGWMQIVGPIMVDDVAAMLQLTPRDVEISFLQLESEGGILRGQFSGRVQLSNVVKGIASLEVSQYEWCERRLLAKIHKLTIAGLRQRVEPVTAGTYVRWLATWQHIAPGTQLAGERGLLEVIRQLQGFEIPANAWEKEVLARRVRNYSSDMLDKLCMKGAVGWGRLSMHPALTVNDAPPPVPPYSKKAAHLRQNAGAQVNSSILPNAPLKIQSVEEEAQEAQRQEQLNLESTNSRDERSEQTEEQTSQPIPISRGIERRNSKGGWTNFKRSLSDDTTKAGEVVTMMPGAIKRIIPTSVAPITFFVRDDSDWMSTLPKSAVNADLSGLSYAAQTVHDFLKQRGASFFADISRGTGLLKAQVETGLWELVTGGLVTADGFDNLRSLIDPKRRSGPRAKRFRDNYGRWTLIHPEHGIEKVKGLEAMCKVLLRRYGVVFRDVCRREANLPPWRDLLSVFRHMEDRGEVRGGRFVNGFIGEQFALPEAADSLRASKNKQTEQTISASAADPLNMIGTILPGEKVASVSKKSVELTC